MAPHRPAQQRRPPWRAAWAGAVAGLVLGTALFAPARWLAAGLEQASGDQVQLLDARGSVWRGSARLVLSSGKNGSGPVALPGTLYWHIQPRWDGVRVYLDTDCCTRAPLQLQATIVGPGDVAFSLANGQSVWPAGLLVGLGTPWNTVQAQGQLAVTSTDWGARWTQGRWTLSGQLQVDATQVSSRLTPIAPMGSYRLTLAGGRALRLSLATLEGSLQLSGQGQWVGERLRFEGEARAAPDRVDALSNLLNILGQRNGARSLIKLGPS